MKVLVTGHDGYIGCSLVPILQSAGHDVVGLDTYLFHDGGWEEESPSIEAIRMDIRDVELHDIEGFDAVIHLAALSNDPLGELDPSCTRDINHRASFRLAGLAKQAGVSRFLFSSSCSLYGAAGDALLDESAAFDPVSDYARSKILAERDIANLADDSFSPVFLRNATAYGASPRFRSDLVVNDLAARAYTSGEIRLSSDGTPWRPLVHVEDISRAFLELLEAPVELVHNESFNIGSTQENYQILEVAQIVEDVIPHARITFSDGAGPDRRTYRVSCAKFAERFPESRPRWIVRDGVRELLAFFRTHGVTREDVTGSSTRRLRRMEELRNEALLGPDLRWIDQGGATGVGLTRGARWRLAKR